jgi:hypothetical protein
MGSLRAVTACVLSCVAVLSLLASPVAALDRSEGDYWVYSTEMGFEGIDVSGTYRYEFSEKDTITVGSESYDVNVLEITGSLDGQTDDFLGMSAAIEIDVHGFVYEVQGSMASLKEDIYLWANVTVDMVVEVVIRMESQDVVTYSPPQMTGFVDGETGTGDQWDETTNMSSTSTIWVDGVIDETDSDESEETYSFSIAAAEDSVVTDAGTFSCLKMTVTDGEGDFDIYWYSSDVGSWVKAEMYNEGDSEPYTTLELSEYSYSKGSGAVILIIAGVGVAVLVVVVVAVLLMAKRRGQKPVVVPPQAPPPPPPGA